VDGVAVDGVAVDGVAVDGVAVVGERVGVELGAVDGAGVGGEVGTGVGLHNMPSSVQWISTVNLPPIPSYGLMSRPSLF
jgi:hypothetical protein